LILVPYKPTSSYTPRSGISTLDEASTDETAAINRADERKAATNQEYSDVDVFDAQLK
jgi:hypothetical protein